MAAESITKKFYALIAAVKTNTLDAEQQEYLVAVLEDELIEQLWLHEAMKDIV